MASEIQIKSRENRSEILADLIRSYTRRDFKCDICVEDRVGVAGFTLTAELVPSDLVYLYSDDRQMLSLLGNKCTRIDVGFLSNSPIPTLVAHFCRG